MNTRKDWIQTYTGKKFFPLAPKAEDLNIRDQARALSMFCRYCGHVSKFYSVAEHSVRVSRELELRGAPLWIQQQGLVHDNTEAYLGDVTRPLKHQPAMKMYRKAEERLQRMIFAWLGLPVDESKAVKLIDTEILGTEVAVLKQPVHPEWKLTTSTGGLAEPWKHVRPDDIGWMPWVAELQYKKRFFELFGQEAQRYL